MKGIITVIKIFAVLTVLGILGALILFLRNFQKDFAKPMEDRKERLGNLIEKSKETTFKRGEREFNRAVELIAMERLDDAREKLLFIQNLHADSEFGPEARRILGEINLDELLSVENMANKKIHTVRPGESYIKIAQQHRTTLDCIMFLNGLLDAKQLHPGDEMIVMSLDYKLVVDLSGMRVALFHRDLDRKEHVFAKGYPILKFSLPNLGSHSIHTKINSKVGEVNGRSYQPIRSNYRNGTKVLGVKAARRNIQLRPLPKIDDVDQGDGIFLSVSTMEELAMLIRVGNEVEIKPAK